MKKQNKDNHDFSKRLSAIAESLVEDENHELAKVVRTAADIIQVSSVRIEQFERVYEAAESIKEGDYWSWQGDGEDHLASMGNGMKVVIDADELRDIVQHKYITSEINSVGMDEYDRATSDGTDDDFDRAMQII